MKYELIKISGVVVGVGKNLLFKDKGTYSEKICETLFDTGSDKRDAANSKRYAEAICYALNKIDEQPSIQKGEDYWKQRCEAAEAMLETMSKGETMNVIRTGEGQYTVIFKNNPSDKDQEK